MLNLLAQGLPDDEVAAKLGISRNTLRNHVAVIYGKLGINRRGALVIWARERGLGVAPKPRTTQPKSKSKKRA